jgi:hypothetical protein
MIKMPRKNFSHKPYSEWAKMGSDLKKMRKLLFDMWFHRGFQDCLLKREQDGGFNKIDDGINHLKDRLEEAMFIDISKDYVEPRDLFDVFYDSPAGEEPHPEPKGKDGVIK